MPKHKCLNQYRGDGARGACYLELDPAEEEGKVHLGVGWSCVVVYQSAKPVPISWIAEVIAIATDHEGGIEGFLRENHYGGSESYALEVDPPEE